MDATSPQDGDFFEGVLLETFRDYEVTRPRVRPVEVLPHWLKVEFPRGLREANPIGTLFRADVFVRQKHYANGQPKGPLYLRADNATIVKIAEPTTDTLVIARQQRGTISGRAYEYFRISSAFDTAERNLFKLRSRAYASAVTIASLREADATRRERLKVIVEYARARAEGFCECCEKPAPFIRHNNEPYLEIHHIVALSRDGTDHPANVAAICPNCHAQITHGKDGTARNLVLKERVAQKEKNLSAKTAEG
jgi:5-methylcytosine-specific restriction endonuclease McrA